MSEHLSDLPSEYSEKVVQPSEGISEEGIWLSKQEAVTLLKVSEKTIETRVKTGEYRGEKRNGRAFVFIPNGTEASEAGSGELTESKIVPRKVFGNVPNRSEVGSEVGSESFLDYFRKESEGKSEEIRNLQEQLRKLEKDLTDERIKVAKLEGEMKGKDNLIAEKDNTIQAKEQAINAANAAVMLMEQQKQTLDAQTPKQLETALKKPWWRFGI